MRDFIEDVVIPVAIILVVTILVVTISSGALSSVINRATFRQDIARIEQLRLDSSGIDPGQSEDVIGKVVDANLTIARNRACNTQWWCDWLVPDGWDFIPMLTVPGQKVSR